LVGLRFNVAPCWNEPGFGLNANPRLALATRFEKSVAHFDRRRPEVMSKRIDTSWTVFVSVENSEHDRCVDFFSRADGSYGFEEFRRDIEDGGEWTPVQYYSGVAYVSSAAALDAAERSVPWLVGSLDQKPELRMRIGLG
jgi:hypothetical protein